MQNNAAISGSMGGSKSAETVTIAVVNAGDISNQMIPDHFLYARLQETRNETAIKMCLTDFRPETDGLAS